MIPRQTARVLLFDSAGRVLLIHCTMTLTSEELFDFWVTPGGEIERGEEPTAAARRELREELGLDVEVHGPLYTERNQFELSGEMRDNQDFIFLARCPADAAPVLRGVTTDEIAIMREIRWWSAPEVASALAVGQKIFPVDLPQRMQQFA